MSAGSLSGRTVLVAGATSTSGAAVARALTSAGAAVVAVGTRPDALEALHASVPGVTTHTCDLADLGAVTALAAAVHETAGSVDGLVHLVGGWRGGGGIAGQSDDDWDFFDRAFRTLRNTTRVFYDDLVASPAGRLAFVSSTAVDSPTAGAANYAAAKAASDAWVRAVAQGFRKDAPDSAAATVFVVGALAGLEERLGDEAVRLWTAPPADVNGARLPLSAAPAAASNLG
ncbi:MULTISPECIES: SDR family NAD(P)-dependent oxidoreductase [unclassified Curtobacterium]|uniref:SDR family oxidoreductase n=1 Tax=unclassified Curtobacterium TaxID=257496 RepID=UPI0010DE5A98|nr:MULTISPECIES: SDR family NAD(P)-dependent oxidoreductase [unclassified Curtobacterium]TCL78418.1 short subunit dehydrogenase [Curtobacterium sp. PhB128]TCL95179.1 short subunit dehydrogenase [Curtobacterium sp. PhB138]